MKKKFIQIIILCCCLLGANAQSDWEIAKEENGITVWTKDYPDSSFKQFKAESTIDAALENVVAVFLDIENMGAWYDRVEKVDLVEKISNEEGIYIIDFELPWPVSDRISAVRATLTRDATNKKVTVKTQYESEVVEDTDKVLVTRIHSEWILTEKENGQVHIFHKGFMDPGGSLPAWIANSGVKEGPVNTLTSLVDILPQYSK